MGVTQIPFTNNAPTAPFVTKVLRHTVTSSSTLDIGATPATSKEVFVIGVGGGGGGGGNQSQGGIELRL